MPKPESAPTLRLLGGAVIQSGDTPLGGPAAHRHRLALLALLAANGRPMSRDKLVAFLWPERDNERARNLLKTAVHELRKLFGENAIRSTGDQLSIDITLLRCDVWDFEAAVASKDYERAVSLYGGPFLDGFFLKDALEFERWVDEKRARLENTYARVSQQLAAATGLRLDAASAAPAALPAPTPPPAQGAAPLAPPTKRDTRRVSVAAAILVVLLVGVLVGSTRLDRARNGVTQAGVAAITLPDDEIGTALAFNGINTNASTPLGSIVTERLDNVGVDMLVRFDGFKSRVHQMIYYNGHGAVSGWGLMVLSPGDPRPEGTIGVLAGGIIIAATPLVLEKGKWSRLSAERRDGKVTVTLGGRTHALGNFPVYPLSAKHRAIERTSIGGDGTFDAPTGAFHGAIDRVRIRDLAGAYWIERWNFDEGKGPHTVGARGAMLRLGRTAWIAALPIEPRDVFWSRMESLCGQSFGGRLAEGSPADSIFRRVLIMHVRSCTPSEIRIALHVGGNRSRTWVLTRADTGLRLKHDHRHEDGTPDAITQYGGDTRDSGSVSRQEFHADAYTASLLPTARTNVWAMEIAPNERFAYSLRRVGTDRYVRLEFDLTKHVASPPPPWGTPP